MSNWANKHTCSCVLAVYYHLTYICFVCVHITPLPSPLPHRFQLIMIAWPQRRLWSTSYWSCQHWASWGHPTTLTQTHPTLWMRRCSWCASTWRPYKLEGKRALTDYIRKVRFKSYQWPQNLSFSTLSFYPDPSNIGNSWLSIGYVRHHWLYLIHWDAGVTMCDTSWRGIVGVSANTWPSTLSDLIYTFWCIWLVRSHVTRNNCLIYILTHQYIPCG